MTLEFYILSSNARYMYFPKDLTQIIIVYVVFGIGISLGIAFIGNKIKNLLLKIIKNII